MMQNNQHNVTTIRGRYANFSVRVDAETPQIKFGEVLGHIDTLASATLTAELASDFGKGVDANKMQLFMGGTNPKHYRGDSVLGVLVNRLERRFGKVGVLVLGGLENNELTYRVQLHPIPDKYDGNRDCNSARFIGAVRQELRQIARELDPRQRLQGGR